MHNARSSRLRASAAVIAALGYRLGRDTRVGVGFTRSRRLSPDPLRRYEGNQVGTSITYGS